LLDDVVFDFDRIIGYDVDKQYSTNMKQSLATSTRYFHVREWANVSNLTFSSIKKEFLLYVKIDESPGSEEKCHIKVNGTLEESETFLDVNNPSRRRQQNMFLTHFMTTKMFMGGVPTYFNVSDLYLLMVYQVSESKIL